MKRKKTNVMGVYLNNRRVAFFVLLLIIVSLLYSSTFHAPFNFDDEAVIKLETVETVASIEGGGGHSLFPLRYRQLFYSSLVFNYSHGKLNPFGYHLVNISLHIFTAIVIFFIASVTLERGFSLGKKEAFSIASFTTLLFTINPVNSETVNYISARAVGMSSFFYLSALLSFILGSLRMQKSVPRFLFYLLSFTCFLASILSKETALTFPITILLYDICFMRKDHWTTPKNRFLFFYLPLIACSVFAVFKVLTMQTMIINWWQRIDIEYGLKQIQIIGHGVRLILFPIGLTFDYNFPNTFFAPNSLIITVILLGLGMILGVALYYPSAFAMLSFSIFWFLITLAPTNSILPRPDLLSERNLYLPSFGIIFLIATLIFRLVLTTRNKLMVKKIGLSCLFIFLIFQATLLYERNLTYRSNTVLWEDSLEKSPGKLRALHNLSHFYLVEKNYGKAFITLRSLVNSNASPHYISYAHSNLGSIYLQLGDYPKAENEFKLGIKVKPNLPTNHFNLGSLLASQGRNLEAKKSYDKAEDLYKNYKWGYKNPNQLSKQLENLLRENLGDLDQKINQLVIQTKTPPELYINKARLLLKLKLYGQAKKSIDNYLDFFPESGSGHFILGNIFSATGKLQQALDEYNKSGEQPSLKAQAHNNRALIFITNQEFNQALEELKLSIKFSPNLIDAHYNLGNLLIQIKGDLIKARWHLEKALKLTNSQEGANRIRRALNTLP